MRIFAGEDNNRSWASRQILSSHKGPQYVLKKVPQPLFIFVRRMLKGCLR